MPSLNCLRRELTKLQAKEVDDSVRFRLLDGSIATLTRKNCEPDDVYAAWVYSNADTDFRASDGSAFHIIAQAVAGNPDRTFIPWDRWSKLYPVMLTETIAGTEV